MDFEGVNNVFSLFKLLLWNKFKKEVYLYFLREFYKC